MNTETNYELGQLAFPALCLAKDLSISVAGTPEALEQCTATLYYGYRYFDDLIILDSNGGRYRVIETEIAWPLTAMKKWAVRTFGGTMDLRLRLHRELTASVGTAKQQVLEWMGRDPSFWESNRKMAEWKRLIESAPDMATLIDLFE